MRAEKLLKTAVSEESRKAKNCSLVGCEQKCCSRQGEPEQRTTGNHIQVDTIKSESEAMWLATYMVCTSYWRKMAWVQNFLLIKITWSERRSHLSCNFCSVNSALNNRHNCNVSLACLSFDYTPTFTQRLIGWNQYFWQTKNSVWHKYCLTAVLLKEAGGRMGGMVVLSFNVNMHWSGNPRVVIFLSLSLKFVSHLYHTQVDCHRFKSLVSKIAVQWFVSLPRPLFPAPRRPSHVNSEISGLDLALKVYSGTASSLSLHK